MNEEGPVISFDLHMEFYLEYREDPVLAMMELEVPVEYIREIGVGDFMEHCLADFLEEINQRSVPFVVLRASSGMRQVFFERSIQGVSLHAPDFERIQKLTEEAINDQR